ncbi:MAG: hypothetical protein RMX96_31865 [Nostoc sp. ChiSLP02]|nr:hypothetical protein [Nostoc sp. DedSLP01]MDZ8189421.1 hypothetical protein [Nostoc sp. ChiSLP02]
MQLFCSQTIIFDCNDDKKVEINKKYGVVNVAIANSRLIVKI